MTDMERIEGALETIGTSIAGARHNAVQWGLAWRDAIRRLNTRMVLKSCREMTFEGTEREKRTARMCTRIVRRGVQYAKQVDEIERDLSMLYPADVAQRRLDEELGHERRGDDSFGTTLDRACMRSRASNPSTPAVRLRAHEYLRHRFDDLDVAEPT